MSISQSYFIWIVKNNGTGLLTTRPDPRLDLYVSWNPGHIGDPPFIQPRPDWKLEPDSILQFHIFHVLLGLFCENNFIQNELMDNNYQFLINRTKLNAKDMCNIARYRIYSYFIWI